MLLNPFKFCRIVCRLSRNFADIRRSRGLIELSWKMSRIVAESLQMSAAISPFFVLERNIRKARASLLPFSGNLSKNPSKIQSVIILGEQPEVKANVDLRPLPVLPFETFEMFKATIHDRYALAERIEIGFVLVPRVHEDGSPEVGVVRTHLGQEEIDLVNMMTRRTF